MMPQVFSVEIVFKGNIKLFQLHLPLGPTSLKMGACIPAQVYARSSNSTMWMGSVVKIREVDDIIRVKLARPV